MVNLAQNTYLNWIAMEEVNRQTQVRTYRSYYEGDQPSLMTDRQAEYLNLQRNKNLGVNVCAVIVDALAERLEVTGFTVSRKDANKTRKTAIGSKARDTKTGVASEPDVESDDTVEELSTVLDGWWQDNRMDGVQGWVHTAAARDTEAFVVIEYDQDEERPYLCHDYAYDGTSGVKVHMKPGTYNRVAFASKRWVETNSMGESCARLNLYFTNRIEKWISKATGGHNEAFWQPHECEGTTLVTLKDDAGTSYQASAPW